eukprot:Gb_24291 [translate_table: standard]
MIKWMDIKCVGGCFGICYTSCHVNGTNLTEVEGGEVVATNLEACNGPRFILDLHLKKKHDAQGHKNTSKPSGTLVTFPDLNSPVAEESANARITCFYFPIIQGKESIDNILEKLDMEGFGMGESFETFCRVSIRRLGRLLPDARWVFPLEILFSITGN